jgi:histidinol-phosphate/aromatic aminotransferase/cobyric acid decarboxylase-like protein
LLSAALEALGVVVRAFPNRPGLASTLRITLPGNAAEFERLVAALQTALAGLREASAAPVEVSP